MITTALGIVGTIFACIGVVLSQINYLQSSIWFGILSILFYVLALFAHRKETNKSIAPNDPDGLVVSELHHPDLNDPRYSNCVLWCSIVNKSGQIVTINKVLAFDSADRLLPIKWSDQMNSLGNPGESSGLIGIKDMSSLYLRHRHGTDLFFCKLEIYHSLSDKPLTRTFDAYEELHS